MQTILKEVDNHTIAKVVIRSKTSIYLMLISPQSDDDGAHTPAQEVNLYGPAIDKLAEICQDARLLANKEQF